MVSGRCTDVRSGGLGFHVACVHSGIGRRTRTSGRGGLVTMHLGRLGELTQRTLLRLLPVRAVGAGALTGTGGGVGVRVCTGLLLICGGNLQGPTPLGCVAVCFLSSISRLHVASASVPYSDTLQHTIRAASARLPSRHVLLRRAWRRV